MKLGVYDTNRLSELVSTYMNSNSSDFYIFKNGEVYIGVIGTFRRFIGIKPEGTMDFLEVVKKLGEAIVKSKNGSKSVEDKCGKALGILISTNDRKKVIELLYSAHLSEEEFQQKPNNQNQNRRPKEISVEVRDRVVTKYGGQPNRREEKNLADLLNSADEVYVIEE